MLTKTTAPIAQKLLSAPQRPLLLSAPQRRVKPKIRIHDLLERAKRTKDYTPFIKHLRTLEDQKALRISVNAKPASFWNGTPGHVYPHLYEEGDEAGGTSFHTGAGNFGDAAKHPLKGTKGFSFIDKHEPEPGTLSESFIPKSEDILRMLRTHEENSQRFDAGEQNYSITGSNCVTDTRDLINIALPNQSTKSLGLGWGIPPSVVRSILRARSLLKSDPNSIVNE